MTAKPMMSFGEAVKTCFKKYVDFSGRARRSEFWWFSLLNYIIGICTYALVSWKLGVQEALQSQTVEAAFDQDKYNALIAQAESVDNTFFPLLCLLGIISLAMLLPSLAVTVRRLHDTGRSGWLILLLFIPLVNCIAGIVLFIFELLDSKPEDNKYGPSPKYISEA